MNDFPANASAKEETGEQQKKRLEMLRRPIVWLVTLFVAISALYLVVRPEEPEHGLESPALVSVFEQIERLGFVPNRSLAGYFRPGDILQTREEAMDLPEGARKLQSNIVALRSELCFPDLKTMSSPFPLPDDQSFQAASYGLQGARLTELIPGIAAGDAASAQYRLSFRQPRILAFPKLEMSDQFAHGCARRLESAAAAGDRTEWFEVVQAVVIADGFTLEVERKEGSDLDLDAALRRTEQALQSSVRESEQASESDDLTAARIQVSTKGERKTVWTVDAQVMLGFRTRPIEPVSPQRVSAETPSHPFNPSEPERWASSKQLVGRIAIRRIGDDGRDQYVQPTYAFQTGDQFRFEVTSNRRSEVSIFHRQTSRAGRQLLWPSLPEHLNKINAGESILIPAPGNAFQMQGEPGPELFIIALTNLEAVSPELGLNEPTSYVIRNLGEALTRNVHVVEQEDHWLRFSSEEKGEPLAVLSLHLLHNPGP